MLLCTSLALVWDRQGESSDEGEVVTRVAEAGQADPARQLVGEWHLQHAHTPADPTARGTQGMCQLRYKTTPLRHQAFAQAGKRVEQGSLKSMMTQDDGAGRKHGVFQSVHRRVRGAQAIKPSSGPAALS